MVSRMVSFCTQMVFVRTSLRRVLSLRKPKIKKDLENRVRKNGPPFASENSGFAAKNNV
jgi:hypothetical protein